MNFQCYPIAETGYEVKGEVKENVANNTAVNGADKVHKAIDAKAEETLPSNLLESEDDMALDVLINQIEFVRVLSTARDVDDLHQRISEVLHRLGFSDYAFIRNTPSRAFDVTLSSLPQELIDTYQADMLYVHDMVLDYIKTGNPEPIFHSTIAQLIESTPLLTLAFKKNQEILALYKLFDFNDAYLMPVQANRGQGEDYVLFSVMAQEVNQDEFMAMTDRCRPILRLLADAVNFILDTKFSPRKSKSKRVPSPRPMRLLTTMAKYDLSLSQAASKLCISIDTANKHMAIVKKALGTRSQANAVYLALKQGLIDFS